MLIHHETQTTTYTHTHTHTHTYIFILCVRVHEVYFDIQSDFFFIQDLVIEAFLPLGFLRKLRVGSFPVTDDCHKLLHWLLRSKRFNLPENQWIYSLWTVHFLIWFLVANLCLVLVNIIFNRILLSRLGLQNTPSAFLQRGKTPHPNECSWYDTKLSDGEVPIMLELWEMRSNRFLPPLPGLLRPIIVALDRVLSLIKYI